MRKGWLFLVVLLVLVLLILLRRLITLALSTSYLQERASLSMEWLLRNTCVVSALQKGGKPDRMQVN